MAQSNTEWTNGGNGNGNSNGHGQRELVRRTRFRGFAAMDAERRRRISSVGGKAAHAKGTGHEFTREEAREAGRKGGRASAAARALRMSTEQEAVPTPSTRTPGNTDDER
jgi:general stress protein YciG